MMIPMFGLNPTAINTMKQIPNRSNTYTGLNTPKTILTYTKTSKLENVGCMNLSVLKTNLGGDRGVLPCVGTPFSHIVLRRPALPTMGGIYPHTGFARDQKKGMAYQADKPMDLPLMPVPDFYNKSMNSKLSKK